MKCLHIITPVKDSIDSTLETVKAIMESDILVPFTYTVYNDFSTEENTHRLEEAARQWNFRLVNLSANVYSSVCKVKNKKSIFLCIKAAN